MGKAIAKIERLRAVMAHREADRIPAGDFFWTGHMVKAKAQFGMDFDPYRAYDLDYIVMTPNMDPEIRPFQILEQIGEDIVLKTGFGATVRRSGTAPMPYYERFSVQAPDEMAKFRFDDPSDGRRFFEGGDDQLNCVGDALLRNIKSWDARVNGYVEDFAVFGSVCEAYEYLWRIVGTENAMYWMKEEPVLFKDFVERIGDFLAEFLKAQIKAGQGRLSGAYVWGDVAYRNGMLFSPADWREIFKPQVARLIDICHENNLMVVYHGCGNAVPIFDDLVEMGLDAYNPLEAKADLDVVELKRKYAGKLSFAGNIDVRALESGDPGIIRKEVLYKMQAGQGGGWIFQSDHSVSSGVSPESYKLAIEILRQYGNYPLDVELIKSELDKG
jgi:uroporphyrinogen decarboxylase